MHIILITALMLVVVGTTSETDAKWKIRANVLKAQKNAKSDGKGFGTKKNNIAKCKKTDNYFHAKANCEAAQKGVLGSAIG